MSGTPPLRPEDELRATVELSPSSCLSVSAAVAALPSPSALGAEQWLCVVIQPDSPKGFLSRLLRRGASDGNERLAERCTALLAAGYELVCADSSGAAYGRAPRS